MLLESDLQHCLVVECSIFQMRMLWKIINKNTLYRMLTPFYISDHVALVKAFSN